MTFSASNLPGIHSASDTGHVIDHNSIRQMLSDHDNILTYSASLAAAITDETGSGSLVFNTNPVFITGASVGSNAITTTANAFTDLTGTVSSSVLASRISDETGSGSLVFNTSPTFTGTVNASNVVLSGTASVAGNTYLPATASVGGVLIASQSFVTSQGYLISSGSIASASNSASLGGVPAASYAQLASPSFTGTLSASNATLTGNLTASVNNVYLSTTASMGSSPILSASNVQTVTGKTLTTASISGTGLIYLGSTSGTSTIVASSAAGTGTLTLPVGTDTLVGASITQTLTNKTIAVSGSNTISGLTNSNLSGTASITNANLLTPSVTIGSSSVSLGGTLTTIAGLTLTSPTINTGSISSGSFGGTITNGAVINGGSYSTASINAGSFSGNITNSGSITGGTLVTNTASALTISAGTTASPAITMASTANLTTNAVVGGIEYDGVSLYFTPSSSISRSIVATAAMAVVPANANIFGNNTAASAIFPAAYDTINVTANTTYEFEIYFQTAASATITTASTIFQFGGTASTNASVSYVATTFSNSSSTALSSPSIVMGYSTASIALVNTSTNPYRGAFIKGIMRIATSGPLIPQIAYSASPGISSSIVAGTYMKIAPVGASAFSNTAGWA